MSFPVLDDLVVRVPPKVSVPRLFDLLRLAGRDAVFADLSALAPTANVEGLLDHVLCVLGASPDRARAEESLRVRRSHGLRPGREARRRRFRRALRVGAGVADLGATPETTDVDENRIVLWALHRAAQLRVEDPRLAFEVARARPRHGCQRHPDAVRRVGLQVEGIRAGDLDYRSMHAACALVLNRLGSAPGRGSAPFPAFGFDMWSVFEGAVTSLLRDRLGPRLRLIAKPNVPIGAGMTFVPDMLLLDGDDPVAVAYIKYKASLVRQDVQQVVAYATALGMRDATFIYPTPVGGGLRVGGVRVPTSTFDLALPPSEAADRLVELLLWASTSESLQAA